MSIRILSVVGVCLICAVVAITGCIKFGDDRTYTIESGGATNITFAFLDVGHGDCTIITSGDDTIVVDTGSVSSSEHVLNYLYKNNVKDIDYMFVTHPHDDHYGGVTSIYNYYVVNKYYTNKNTSRGDKYTIGNINMYVLNPPRSEKYSNVNDESIVLMIEKNNFRVLLTGDIEKAAENDILNSGLDIDADVLKVSHHGSDSSSQEKFLLRVSPSISVISCSDKYNNPSEDVVDRLMHMGNTVYITKRDGDIIMTTDGNGILRVDLPQSDILTTYMQTGDFYLK